MIRNGALYCFCEIETKEFSNSRFKDYTFTYSDPETLEDIHVRKPICKVYYQIMTGPGYLIVQSFNYLIVLASFIVRTFFIWIAEKVGFVSRTSETRFVMVSVFLITYLNYGLIHLFSSYDDRGEFILPISRFFNGLYPDFNALWLNDIGALIIAIMISNMYWPPLEFFMFWGLRLLYRIID